MSVEALFMVQMEVPTGSSDDIRHLLLPVVVAGEALVVMDVPGKDEIGQTFGLLRRVVENLVQVRTARVVTVQRVDGMVHGNDQRLTLGSVAHFFLEPGDLRYIE